MPLGPINATCSPGASVSEASDNTACALPGAKTVKPDTARPAPNDVAAAGPRVPCIGVGSASSCGRPSNNTAICVTAASAVARS
ncbi:hypothetical protein D3C73_1259050 [compost metagenome]